jgi:cell division protein FtsW
VWIAVGVPVMIGISMMPRERAKRIRWRRGLLLRPADLRPDPRSEVNGATRWIDIGIGQLQPSEFLKPFFVVAMAWLLSLKDGDKSLPIFPISACRRRGLLPLDEAARFRIDDHLRRGLDRDARARGGKLRTLAILGAVAVAGVILAYFFYDVATCASTSFSSARAIRSDGQCDADADRGRPVRNGPGGGTRKFGLPEPHTDYIFSVIGEEFGLIACFAIALLLPRHRRARADQASGRGQ